MAKLEKLAASLLMWECGLKLIEVLYAPTDKKVTPYVGVWIETLTSNEVSYVTKCHSLCGSVD